MWQKKQSNVKCLNTIVATFRIYDCFIRVYRESLYLARHLFVNQLYSTGVTYELASVFKVRTHVQTFRYVMWVYLNDKRSSAIVFPELLDDSITTTRRRFSSNINKRMLHYYSPTCVWTWISLQRTSCKFVFDFSIGTLISVSINRFNRLTLDSIEIHEKCDSLHKREIF